MVRFTPPTPNQAAQQENDPRASSIQSYLESSFSTVDTYLTSVQAYLPHLQQQEGSAEQAGAGHAEMGAQAHAAVMQQLSARTPQMVGGIKLLEMVQATRLLPTCVDSVDALLGGGLRETTVTEVAGETCSGKTQLCHVAAVTTAQRGERVVYCDTTNAFCTARAVQLIDSPSQQVVQGTLANITVVRCHSIHALLSSLDELAQQATKNASSTWPKLVIVDSVSAVLSAVIGATQHNQGHVVVAETARLLRHIAHALQCCVLVTNHVVGAGGSFTPGGREDSSAAASSSGSRTAPGGTNLRYKPALGEQWKGAAHVRLQLSRAGGDLVAASLLTHPMNGWSHWGWHINVQHPWDYASAGWQSNPVDA